MTTLVANIAVDMSQIGQQVQSFFQAAGLAQDSATTTDAKYHNTSLGMSVEFTGTSLTYVTQGTIQVLNGGTINAFEIDSPIGTLGYKFSGFSATLPNFVDLSGADTLTGSPFNDLLAGFAGADTITGGRGKDLLSGGADNDVFDFNSKLDSTKGANHDVIEDFSGTGLEGDRINLHDIDANTRLHGNQNFHFIGGNHFHRHAGELHVLNAGAGISLVEGDVNGDGRADFQIEVHSAAALVKADFVL